MGKLQRIKMVAGDRRWWWFYLQRRITNPVMRQRVARRLSQLRPEAGFADVDRAQRGAGELRDRGMHHLGDLLSADQCAELVRYFESKPVRDPYRTDVERFLPCSTARPENCHIAHHDAADIVAAPFLLTLANDERVLDVVGDFLGCKPTIGYMATWWSYPTGAGPQQAENFHRDVDDWRFVKLFVYLTDVGDESGPHKYVIRSSNDSRLSAIRRFDDAEVVGTFGSENVMTMTSRAGEGFLEDTYGIHKGQPVRAGRRLLFQVVYTLTPLPYAPRKPVAALADFPSADKWTNRFYLG